MVAKKFFTPSGLSVGIGDSILITDKQSNYDVKSTDRMVVDVTSYSEVNKPYSYNYNQTVVNNGTSLTNLNGISAGVPIASSADGKIIILGLYKSGVNNCGQVYVYSRDSVGSTFSQIGILTGTGTGTNNSNRGYTEKFGYSVACNSDATTIVVGCPDFYNGINYGRGRAYVFKRIENTFEQVGILTNSTKYASNYYFGKNVACSGDGNTVLCSESISARIYVFDKIENTNQYAKFKTLGIGTPANYTDISPSRPIFTSVSQPELVDCAVSQDGKRVIFSVDRVGINTEASPFDYPGLVFVFDRGVHGENSFDNVAILEGNLNSGSKIACNSDAKIIAVSGGNVVRNGITFYGSVQVYEEDPIRHDPTNIFLGSTTNPYFLLLGSQSINFADSFGNALSVSDDGNYIVVGAPSDEISVTPYPYIEYHGLVYIFKRDIFDPNIYREYEIVTAPNTGNLFGSSVKITSGLETLLVSNPNSTVYAYDRNKLIGREYFNIGIGSTNPSSKLSVVGNANISGVITANKFVGDGKEITNNTGIYTGIVVSNNNFNASAAKLNFSSSFNIANNSGLATISIDSSYLSLHKVLQNGNITDKEINVADIVSSGIVSANSFSGSAINLRNLFSINQLQTSNLSDISNSTLGIGTAIKINLGQNKNIGIGTTNATSKLTVQGDGKFSGFVTATNFSGTIAGTISTETYATYATTAGTATYATNAGVSTYADVAGIATVAQGLTGNITVDSITANDILATNINIELPASLLTHNLNSTDINNHKFGILNSTSGVLVGSSPSYGASITSNGNASFTGIVTASGGFNLGIQSSGINVNTGVITSINFSGSGLQSVSFDSQNKISNIKVGEIIGIRTSVQGTTSSISVGSTANLTLSASKSYILHKVGVSTAAWVRLYTDSNSRTSDEFRFEITSPSSGSGVIAEVITSGISTVLMTPGVIGFNNDDPATSNVYLAITNKGTSTQEVTVTLNYVPIQGTS